MRRFVGITTTMCLLLLAAVGPCTAMAASAPMPMPEHHDAHDSGHSCCEEGGSQEARVAQCEKECSVAGATIELRRTADASLDLPVERDELLPESLETARAPRRWMKPPPRAATSPLFVLNDSYLI